MDPKQSIIFYVLLEMKRCISSSWCCRRYSGGCYLTPHLHIRQHPYMRKYNFLSITLSRTIYDLSKVRINSFTLRRHKFIVAQSYGAKPRAGWSGGSSPNRGWEFISSTPRPHRLWGTPSLLSNGYQGLFLWGQSGWGVKLTTHFHLVPRSRMRGDKLPFLQYAFKVWCSVKVDGLLYL
jgi:hypothetical protein